MKTQTGPYISEMNPSVWGRCIKVCSLQWKNENHSAGQRSTGDQKNPNPPRPLTYPSTPSTSSY